MKKLKPTWSLTLDQKREVLNRLKAAKDCLELAEAWIRDHDRSAKAIDKMIRRGKEYLTAARADLRSL